MKTKKSLLKKHSRALKPQHRQPGIEASMQPDPLEQSGNYVGSNKLKNKVAIITGGDSGIGHAVAICFAKEGAHVVIANLDEHHDAKKVKNQVELLGRKCLLISGDLSQEKFCRRVVSETIKQFGRLDILVNNAGEQHPQKNIEDITAKQIIKTFSTNIFAYFYMIKAAFPHLKKGATIINTASVTCYKGSKYLLDYSATKGAIVGMTRSLSELIVSKGIRVNGVAPGPIWTPLVAATYDKSRIKKFGKNVPMGRPGQPFEVAPCYVFLASEDSSYMSGQFLHSNGGTVVNG